MTAEGTGDSRKIDAHIMCDPDVNYNISILGTGSGYMEFTVTYTMEDGSTDVRTFENVPVTASMVANTSNLVGANTLIMTIDYGNGEEPVYWLANSNETVSEPDKNFTTSDSHQDDEPDPGIPETPDIPSTPTYPDYPDYYPSYPNGGSSGSNSSSTPSYQITVPTTTNGTVTVNPKSAKSGDKVTITATPNDGYTTGSVSVTDSSGKSIAVTDNGDGTYTFTMPSGKVTVNVTFVPVQAEQPPVEPTETPWVNPFTDVFTTDWFYSHVQYVSVNGFMTGDGSTTIFNPNGATTRGMIMTILARMEGIDTSGSTPWYQAGMEWAMRSGVSDGTNPEGNITREELATMLWRYAGEPAVAGDLTTYPDAASVQDWAATAMAWAVQNGIINGIDGRLDPQGNAVRSQAVAMLTRFCQNIKA